MSRQKSAEAIVVAAYGDEGPNSLNRTDAEHSMPEGDADKKAAMPEHARRVGGGTAETRGGAHQAGAACEEHVGDQGSLTMEEVICRENMLAAYQRVVGNKGAPGVDGTTVNELAPMLRRRWQAIREELLSDAYRPAPVLKVEIPKPGGQGMRMLGIPTVLDRLIQQALLQVLHPRFDPTFSGSSFGFRPGRSAHQALERAREHIAAGHRWVVDMDLEKFFDRVNHDVLMSRLAWRVKDKRILRLIRRYLQAGMMEGGLVSQRAQGTPQGGPLSPLLSNVLLDELAKELERRGHRFVRYADDCNVYVRSRHAGASADIAGAFPSGTSAFSGQSREKRGGASLETEVPGVHVHCALPAEAEGGPGLGETIQGSRTGDSPSRAWAPFNRRHGGASPAAAWLGVVLPEISGADHVRAIGSVDTSEAAGHFVAAVEASLDASEEPDSTRLGPRAGLDLSDEWPRSLVECGRKPHEPGGPHSPPEPAWPREPHPGVTTIGVFNLNRRVRNRMHGGVGGRRGQPRLLPEARHGATLGDESSLWAVMAGTTSRRQGCPSRGGI
jgi:retron-type reverse transcriptase